MCSKYGYEAPPYFYPPLATGAHISLLPAGVSNQPNYMLLYRKDSATAR
jgi:hypothetical protein